ncbi:uncharacterized protein BDZ99DRAFT_469316 [Mytilinidion resinicola]|uniref:Uncharacterized protein n=1 Tax=Mytilinidion resinicola TaxID=574789 RepID=A0A6A6XZF2_9PEZI|nr:uncharacterized protein BDZ99DRAFT_469316 [Mytilinidion resinicola]KAF2801779.1 hypothetical protein BDZ99DRAFT_469316 [Mytilinidion resinicola]
MGSPLSRLLLLHANYRTSRRWLSIGGGVITGTAVVATDFELPFTQAVTYGPFKEKVRDLVNELPKL